MGFEVTDYQFDVFNKNLKELCGIYLTPDKKYLVQNRLADLIKEGYGGDFQRFNLEWPKALQSTKKKIIELMTTRETFWFREVRQFDYVKDTLLPEVADEIRSGKKNSFKMWSAACSSGQEPYTLAMILADGFPSVLAKSPCPILATDISEDALKQAKEGVYGDFELSRGMPEKFKKFVLGNKINAKIKGLIDFRQQNLMGNFASAGKNDVIFLRNVLIYFADETKKEILTKIYHQLTPTGKIFLSTTERINGLDDLFEKDKSGLFYHKKRMTGFKF